MEVACSEADIKIDRLVEGRLSAVNRQTAGFRSLPSDNSGSARFLYARCMDCFH
jgi:hypothetical protein